MANAFVHIELNTDDLEKAKSFYGKLFKWKVAPYPGMDYVGIDVGGKGTGGGMQLKPMPEAPNSWLPYVEVDDVKKTLAKAKKLGASIVADFMPVGEMGSIGIFMDPSGAPLGVYATAKKPKKKKKKSKR